MTKTTSKYLVSQDMLIFRCELATKTSLNEAIALQRLDYWINRDTVGVEIQGIRWIYNSYEEWKETNFPFWSIKTIQRTFVSLEKRGLVVAMQAEKKHYDRKKYYRIDYEKLDAL
jgi:hypothetical protein